MYAFFVFTKNLVYSLYLEYDNKHSSIYVKVTVNVRSDQIYYRTSSYHLIRTTV